MNNKEAIEDFIREVENISTHNYYPNGETKEMVIPIDDWYKLTQLEPFEDLEPASIPTEIRKFTYKGSSVE